jgi:hypothetical protein
VHVLNRRGEARDRHRPHDEGRELADKGRRGEIAALAARVKAEIS